MYMYILFATPPAHDIGGHVGGSHSIFELLASTMAGELIRGKQHGTGLASSYSALIVA